MSAAKSSPENKTVLVIGAGGVSSVCVHKMAFNPDIFPEIHLASRTKSKCDAIAASVKERCGRDIATYEIDAEEVPAMVNLIRNAIEAMEGQPTMLLTIAARPHGVDMMEIMVADTGHGISEEMQDQLFLPFISTKARGMGLGLSICRTIVEAHGGQMTVEAGANGGATFKFTLLCPPKETPYGD